MDCKTGKRGENEENHEESGRGSEANYASNEGIDEQAAINGRNASGKTGADTEIARSKGDAELQGT